MFRSRFSQLRALQDADDDLTLFQRFPTQYTPPPAAYPIIRDGEDLQRVLVSPNSRFARVGDDIKYLEVEDAFNLPMINATLDCQGAVVSFEAEPQQPTQGSKLDLFSCTVLGFPNRSSWASEVRLSDVSLVYECEV